MKNDEIYDWTLREGDALIYNGDLICDRMDELEPKFKNKTITKKEFSEFKRIIEILTKDKDEMDAKIVLPDCPICFGTELRNISKFYKCKKCGYTFKKGGSL
ncbi:MAG: hypothetical protein GF311_26600 [Candidatus Lokiarchaeota archaeon]|nr:hypothetical protein [Candidatus Lokiarchaeota archaeon]